MKKTFLITVFSLLINIVSAQVGIGTSTPSPASMLEISGTSDGGVTYKGFMPPRIPNLTARDAIAPTAADVGLTVFVMSTGCLQIWDGAGWENIHCISSGTIASDLFISEYVEGSLNNKAIEIANFTGASVNLNNYRLFISRNGGTTTSIFNFNPNFVLDDGVVYVLKHENASNEIIADQTVTNLDFNGNDAIVLQDSAGNTIDILGEVGNDAIYGENVTLRKKPGIGPNGIYTPSEYDRFLEDTYNGLGNHTF